MAIIQQQSQGFDALIQALISKQQLELQKEDQKLRESDFKLRQQEVEFERAQQEEQGQAALSFIQNLAASSPELAGLAEGVTTGAGAQALLPVFQGQQQFELQQDVAQAEITNMDRMAQLEENALALQERLGTEENEIRRRQIENELTMHNQELESRKFLEARAEIASLQQAAFGLGLDPNTFLLNAYGTADPEEIFTGIMEGGFDPATVGERRMTSMMSGFGVPNKSQNEIKNALFTESEDPQAFVDQLFSDDELEDETKAALFMATRAAFPEITLPEEVERDPFFMRLRGFLSSLNRPAPLSGDLGDARAQIQRFTRTGPGN